MYLHIVLFIQKRKARFLDLSKYIYLLLKNKSSVCIGKKLVDSSSSLFRLS